MLYSRARGAWALTMAAWGRPLEDEKEDEDEEEEEEDEEEWASNATASKRNRRRERDYLIAAVSFVKSNRDPLLVEMTPDNSWEIIEMNNHVVILLLDRDDMGAKAEVEAVQAHSRLTNCRTSDH